MAAWSFILTDNNHIPVGEILNAGDRKVAIPLSKLATASFNVRLDNPLADSLMTTSGYVKAYRDRQLHFHGPIISAEEVVDREKATVAVNCVGSGWILSKRLAGKSASGQVFGSATDRAQIVKALIDASNTEGETGIDTSLASISAASTVTYTAGPYKPISECVNDLSLAIDGFDWMIDPLENYVNGEVTSEKIGTFRAAPVIGASRPESLFEYGGVRSNIFSYKRIVSRDTQANKVYHITPGGAGLTTSVITAINTASISDWKLLEDLAQADLLDPTMRQQFADEHVRVRKSPRQIIEFTPHGALAGTDRLPEFGVDYDVGDQLPARATYGRVTRFDATFRVWGVAFDIDALGRESPVLTLAEE